MATSSAVAPATKPKPSPTVSRAAPMTAFQGLMIGIPGGLLLWALIMNVSRLLLRM